MKSHKIKIILSAVLVLLLLIFAGIFFYVSQKLTPKEINQQLVLQLEKTFPNASVDLGEIDIGIGLSVSVDVARLNLKLKDKNKTELFSVSNIKARIPFWAIVTGGGKIEISLDHPEIFYKEMEGSNNWQASMGGLASTSSSSDLNEGKKALSEEKKKINIPSAFYKSSLDFKLQEMIIKYQLKNQQKGQLKISKFLIKGLNLLNPTAFELDSEFKANLDAKKQISLQTLVIGQFNLAEYLNDESISILMMINLNSVKANWAPYQIPDSKTEVKLKRYANSDIEGGIKFSFNSRNNLETLFSVKKDKTLLSNIKTEFFLQDLISIANMPNVEVKAGDSKFTLEGEIENLPDRILPRIKFKIAPDLLVDTQDFGLRTTMDGFWKDSQFEIGALLKLFEGQIDITSRGKYSLDKKENSKFNLPPLDIDVRCSDLKITKEYIQKMMYGQKKEVAAEKSPSEENSKEETKQNGETASLDQGKEQSGTPAASPLNAKISLIFNRIKIDKEDFSGKGRLLISPQKIDLEKLDFSFTGGTGSLTQSTRLNGFNSSTSFNLVMTKLNMKGLNAFLPPNLKSIEGIYSGNVGGTVDKSKNSLKYNTNVNVTANKGEIKGLNLTEKVQSLLSSIPLLKDKIDSAKNYEVSSNFETLSFKGNFKHDFYQIDKFEFIGIDKKVEIKGNGKIYPPPSKESADFFVDFTDQTGKISGILEKNVGTKTLPMKLVGEGFSLKPDYSYTLSKLAKSGFETKAKGKLQEKASEKIKDILGDKINKQGVDKLLRGIFK